MNTVTSMGVDTITATLQDYTVIKANSKRLVRYLGVSECDEVNERFRLIDGVGEQIGRVGQLGEHDVSRLVRMRRR